MALLPYTLAPGKKCDLSKFDCAPETKDYNKTSAKDAIKDNSKVIIDLARKLYAEDKRSVLLVLQGMDTSGKDGTIRTIMKGVNPQSCQVTNFKKPSEEELDHDFLWRIHQAVPRKGNIGIFNRSHYEDVLVVRVHSLVPESVWSKRYDQINDFERLLTESGTVLIKCFLHIDKDTQRRRLQDRIDDPEAHWKFNPQDLSERRIWDQYQQAYEAAITKCNTSIAPWYIIPSGRKWYRNLVVSNLLRKVLEDMKPDYPDPVGDYTGMIVE
ncbi:MAG: polyphosphate kinase 2 family protein [Pirellulaceae bacterium]